MRLNPFFAKSIGRVKKYFFSAQTIEINFFCGHPVVSLSVFKAANVKNHQGNYIFETPEHEMHIV